MTTTESLALINSEGDRCVIECIMHGVLNTLSHCVCFYLWIQCIYLFFLSTTFLPFVTNKRVH